MTIKETFEKFGFNQKETDEYIIYENKKEQIYLQFWKNNFNKISIYTSGFNAIEFELLEAINNQVEEIKQLKEIK